MSSVSQFVGLTSAQSAAVLGSAQETTPLLGVPISSGLMLDTSQTTTSASLTTVVSYTGQGVLELCTFLAASTQTVTVNVVLDGVTVYTYTGAPGTNSAKSVVGYAVVATNLPSCVGAVPFKTSLLIQHQSDGSNNVYTRYKFRKTA